MRFYKVYTFFDNLVKIFFQVMLEYFIMTYMFGFQNLILIFLTSQKQYLTSIACILY